LIKVCRIRFSDDLRSYSVPEYYVALKLSLGGASACQHRPSASLILFLEAVVNIIISMINTDGSGAVMIDKYNLLPLQTSYYGKKESVIIVRHFI